MGRDGEQTKRHLSAKMQLTIALTIEQGFVAPLCHSHFDGKGGCKVFVLRNELNQRLISVNSTDEQKKNGVLDVSALFIGNIPFECTRQCNIYIQT